MHLHECFENCISIKYTHIESAMDCDVIIHHEMYRFLIKMVHENSCVCFLSISICFINKTSCDILTITLT